MDRIRSAQASSSAACDGRQTRTLPAAGSIAWPLRIIRSIDRDRVQSRLNSRVPVHVEVGLLRLPFGFKQRRGFLRKCDRNYVRTSLHGDAGLKISVNLRVILTCRQAASTVNNCMRSPSSISSTSCGSRRPSTCSLRSRASRICISYLASSGKVIVNEAAAAGTEGQFFEVILLRQVGGKRDCVAARRACRTAHGETADFLGGRSDIARAVLERDRPRSHCRSRGWIRRLGSRGDIDIERKKIANGVVIFVPVEPSESIGPTGIRIGSRGSV